MLWVKSIFVAINLITSTQMISSRGLNHLNFTRIPDVNEQSILASGPFIKSVNTTNLKRVTPSDFLKLHNDWDIQTTKKCLGRLKDLVRIVEQKFHQKYTLVLLAGFTNVKWTYLFAHSLHYEGRALDLKLERRTSNNHKEKYVNNANANNDRIHHRLAWFAYKKAGFNYVKVEKNHHGEHVHVSCRR